MAADLGLEGPEGLGLGAWGEGVRYEGFDVAPDTTNSLADVAVGALNGLRLRGFCRLDLGVDQELVAEARGDVQRLAGQGQRHLRKPSRLVADGLLGPEGSARIGQLALPENGVEDRRKEGAGILAFDHLLARVQGIVVPSFPGVLGFAADNRTAGLMHEAREDDEAPPELTDSEASRWLEVFLCHRVFCVAFLGPAETAMRLRPVNDEDAELVQVDCPPGTLLLVLAEALERRLILTRHDRQSAYCLSCFFSGPMLPVDPNSRARRPSYLQSLNDWTLRRMHAVKSIAQAGETFVEAVARVTRGQRPEAEAAEDRGAEKERAAKYEEPDERLLEVAWQPAPHSDEPDSPGRIIFVGAGQELVRALRPLFGAAGFAKSLDAVDSDALLGCDCLVYLGAADGCHCSDEVQVLEEALHLARAQAQDSFLQELGGGPVQWWVTRGCQAAAGGRGRPEHAGLWGLARAVRREAGLKVKCLDLTPDDGGAGALALELLFWLGRLSEPKFADEDELAISSGRDGDEQELEEADALEEEEETALVPRLRASAAAPSRPKRLELIARGSLNYLHVAVQETRRKPQGAEAEIRVRAIGLNFRDVLNVMGLYPGDPGPPGADASGTVLRLGYEVKHIRLGDDVFGQSMGCLSTYNTGHGMLLAHKPLSWSYMAAAAMPVIFVTVEEPFSDIAKLQPGEAVLIHAAAGGVGLVAVQYAQWIGATVYATASSGKRAYLRRLGVERITNTRDGDEFEADMQRFLAEDGREGVDVIINSLTHDNYVQRSLNVLRKGGRFMEIGKRDIWTHEEMVAARPDVQYARIEVDRMIMTEPERYNGYLHRLLKRVEDGVFSPIELNIFEGFDNGIEALKFLQAAKNIGKVVISVPSVMRCSDDADYVISGGTSHMGILSAQFLVEEGAKSLSLLSRSANVASEALERLAWLRSSSASVTIRPCNVSSLDSLQMVAAAMALDGKCGTSSREVRGVIHMAAPPEPARLEAVDRQHLEPAFGEWVSGARHLEAMFAGSPLDFLLLFSASSALHALPCRAAETALAASLDAHARSWRLRGLRATSIQWGPWRDVSGSGLAVLHAPGLCSLSNLLAMAALGGALSAEGGAVAAQPIKWEEYLRSFKARRSPAVPALYANFVPSRPPEDEEDDGEEDEEEGPPPQPDYISHWWQRAMNHLSVPASGTEVRSASCRLPRCWTTEHWRSATLVGADLATEVPAADWRWDHRSWYDPDPAGWQWHRTFSRHCSYTEGLELFDSQLFVLSKAEAATMDPHQRNVLEVGYESFVKAGHRKTGLFHMRCGVYVGASVQNEWQSTAKAETCAGSKLTAFSATATAGSITSNRVSYLLSLKGPSMTLDTGDSSALVAVEMAREGFVAAAASAAGGRAARSKEGGSLAMCAGVRFLLSPRQWPEFQAAGMLSAPGRCFSFNATADGCVLGEAIAAFALRALEREDGEVWSKGQAQPLAVVVGCGLSANGGGASLLTPSGPTEQEVVNEALRDALAAACDVDAVEAHGQGSVMADAVELLSLARALRGEEGPGDPVKVWTSRSNLGNAQHGSAAAALLRAVATAEAATSAPTLHFARVSGYLEDVADYPLGPASEACDFRFKSCFVGVSSRGLGTSAHLLIWSSGKDRHRQPGLNAVGGAQRLLFWPGGGGELDQDAYPDEGFFLASSGFGWTHSELMQDEGSGVYGVDVALDRSRRLDFQIWLDRDPKRALQPALPGASAGSRVRGPSEGDSFWTLDGRLEAAAGRVAGLPGDRYRVRLRVAGKWRLVDWERLGPGPVPEERQEEGGPGDAASAFEYYVVGSWSEWQLQELLPDFEQYGVLACEVCLQDSGSAFVVLRDGDWAQVLHQAPGGASDGGSLYQFLAGPSDAGQVPGSDFFALDGLPGDVFRIELRLGLSSAVEDMRIACRRVKREAVT